MKKIIYLVLVACGIALLPSCSKDSEDTSKVTYFVDMQLQGDADLVWEKGKGFVDPGAKAFENGEDISDKIIVKGTVDVNKLGYYPISYTAYNEDGFPKTIDRKVFVYDPSVTAELSESYTVQDGSYRLYQGSTNTPFSGYLVSMTKLAPGVYYVSDFFGGYYDKRAAYGATYAMTGYLLLKTDNTISLLYSFVQGWGDSLNYIKNGTYDNAINQIKWQAGYGANNLMDFYITLK